MGMIEPRGWMRPEGDETAIIKAYFTLNHAYSALNKAYSALNKAYSALNKAY